MSNLLKPDILKTNSLKELSRTYSNEVECINTIGEELNNKSLKLYNYRLYASTVVEDVEYHVNQLANRPKEFDSHVDEIKLNIQNFKDNVKRIHMAEKEAKALAAGVSATTTISSLGLAVATLGKDAAIGIATVFGKASTGVPISNLYGAARAAAVKAWLGGGTVAAGGGGMKAGACLLGLTGPVGWITFGTFLTLSAGTGVYSYFKNNKKIDEIENELKSAFEVERKYKFFIEKIGELIDTTINLSKDVSMLNKKVGLDYSKFTIEEKQEAGLLVDTTLALSKLLVIEVDKDE